ncbi:MAG: hypothetical protein NC419_06235 [Muribaculaceae bacterium]|nr:hypothetical protein [Muribaculaceae bacterium]
MKTSTDNLEVLIEILGEDWKTKLDNYLKSEEVELNSKGRECIEDFFESCIEEIKEGRTSNLQKVEKKINNDLLYKNLRNYFDGLLWAFYAFAPIRAVSVVDSEKAHDIIEQIFENAILRYNSDILQNYEKYCFDNGSAFADFLNAQDGLCSFIISKNMHRNTMENFIYMQTQLPKGLCRQMADIIDKNFNNLRMNYIIGKLNSLKE